MRAPTLTFKRARELRRTMTLPEVLLWRDLRGAHLEGLRFRRQHPIGPYTLDFFCVSAMLAIEIDGTVHDHPDRSELDRRRHVWLGRRGIRVLRVNASDVLSEPSRLDVLATIAEAARAPSTMLRMVPLPRFAGEDERARIVCDRSAGRP